MLALAAVPRVRAAIAKAAARSATPSAAERCRESPRGAPAGARPAASRAAALRCTDGAARRTASRRAPPRRPRPPYITTTRDATSATTPRSCVIIAIDVPSRCCRSREQLEDLRLDGDVERRRRLVGDDERGVHDERHRDQHALPHAAGELMRILARALGRRRDADERRASRRRGPTPRVAMRSRARAATSAI